jgi:hypothetical protein
MDALSPVLSPAAAVTPPAPVVRATPPADGDTGGHPAAHAGPGEALPPLPAAVQRSKLDPPPPAKLMTREEMAALLSLTS